MNNLAQAPRTHWGSIWALFLAGCTLALHVGKLPAALPLLVNEFSLTLTQTGNLVSIYALLIAGGALLLGVLVSRVGYVPFAIIGIALCALGSFWGMLANSTSALMWSRAIEGFGWIVGAVSLPTLLSSLCVDKDRPIVLGMWGAFMPVGGGLMMLLAPTLQGMGGWRTVWAIATLLTVAGVVTVALVCLRRRAELSTLRRNSVSFQFDDLRKPAAHSALVCFLLYSFLYLGVTSYVPILLVDDSGLKLSTAIYWATLVMICNATGNFASGWIVKWRCSRVQIIAFSIVAMGVLSFITLSVSEPVVRIVAAVLLTGIGGIIPGTLFGCAPLLATRASGVGLMVGFMLTGAGLGQLLGPLVLSRTVEWAGQWYAGGVVFLLLGCFGAWFARGLAGIK